MFIETETLQTIRSRGVKLTGIVVVRGGPGVSPLNHAQDARATFKLHYYLASQLSRSSGAPKLNRKRQP